MVVREVPFVALPREEIDRLYATIEVLAVDEATLRHDPDLLVLHGYVAVHHNYSWLTFRRGNERTLLLSRVLSADGPAPLFLGEEFLLMARRHVEAHLGRDVRFEPRLTGILQEADDPTSPPRIGLLSIARLAERGHGYEAEICGNLELRHARSQFDSCSQVVIDHLAAL